ncbi:MAG: ATP-binding protein, partial [Candidatus Eisenbacteria bacterium]
MIPEFVAQLYAANAGQLAREAVVGLALVGLAGLAVYALRCRSSARACARYERERAKEIEDRERTRVNNLAEILDISNRINANLELEPLLSEVARAVSESLGFRMALVRILDEDNNCFVARAFAGLDGEAVAKLSARTVPVDTFKTWMRDEFRISRSYFISHEYGFWSNREDEVYVPDLGERQNGEWHPMDSLFVPLWTRDQQLVGYLSVDDPVDRRIPTMETIETIEIFANQAVTAIENARLYGRLEEHVAQLSAMTKRLKELNEIKSNFVATVSHELRTPLTSIRAYAETLARDLGNSPRETEIEFLKIIEEEAQRLSTIVEEMLDLSRMESGKVEMKKTEADVRKIVRDVFQVLSPAAHKKYIMLSAPTDGEAVKGLLDEGMIKQLLINLVGNAVKFTPEGGKVSIGIEDRDSTIELCVEDTGIGIPSSNVKRIFDEFYQVDSSATRQYGGVGLGLAIVKSIVEWHDGRIWVESDDGKGAKFTVSLPKRKAVARAGDEVTPADDTWQCEKHIPELVVDMIAELIGVKTASLMLV